MCARKNPNTYIFKFQMRCGRRQYNTHYIALYLLLSVMQFITGTEVLDRRRTKRNEELYKIHVVLK